MSSRGYRKLNRTSDQRRALLRDLVTDLIINEKIETTFEKAKETQRVVEKMITLGKKNTLASRRRAASFVRFEKANEKQNALQKLFDTIAPKYKKRQGGYTRVVRTGIRRGDSVELAIIEFVA